MLAHGAGRSVAGMVTPVFTPALEAQGLIKTFGEGPTAVQALRGVDLALPMLRALGASRWRVRRTMADESPLISLAGTLAGIAAGLVVAVIWVVGMRETTYPGMSMHFPFGLLVTIAVLGVLMGVLAAILPARRAARLDPLAGLRYE